jgi:branched-chain amino acid transport system permease protein
MQVLVDGLFTGLVIGLVAAAFAVVYLPARVFHLALAGIYAAVPYSAWVAVKNGVAWPLAVAIAMAVGVGLSLLCEFLNHRPMRRKGASVEAQLIASLGVFIILVQIVALIFGSETQVFRTGASATTTFFGLALSHSQIVSALVASLLLIIYAVWLWRSGLGLQLRALADNPNEVALKGYDVKRLHLVAFGISGVLGSAGALLTAYDLGFHPNGGLAILLLAIVAVIIGGRQSFLGPILGALLVGISRNLVVWFWSSKWQDAVTFLLLAITLLLIPNGILGRKTRLEARTP